MHAIFVTNELGPKRLYDDEGLIGIFKDSYSDVIAGKDDGIKRRQGNSAWFMELDDEKKIERAKKYPGFNVHFHIYEGKPIWNTLHNLKTLQDPNSANSINVQQLKNDLQSENAKNLEEIKKQMAADSKRYGELFGLVCKAGGEYLKDADPALVAEHKALKEKLGIVEEAVVNE